MTGFFDRVSRDLLYAARTMSKDPAFSVTAVLMLGLAIGGNTAMFTIVRAVLLKPLEYRDAGRLVRVSGGATPVRFEEMKSGAHSFTALGAFTSQENLAMAGKAEPEVLTAARVSANFLEVLGMQPILGRSFHPNEDSRGGEAVAMIGAELWRRRFGGDPRAIGRTAILGTTPYRIVGVLPPRFQFPFPGLDVWLTAPSEWPLMTPKSRALSPFLTVFGRLKPQVNLEQANAELAVLHGRYAVAHPAMLDAKPKSRGRAVPLKDQLVGNVRSMLWMLFGAAGLVLLIACANLAGLLLARAGARSREFAVRSALGAAPARLVKQLLAESLLLSSAGGAFGLLLASWILGLIPHLGAVDLPRAGEIRMDWAVFLFAAALSIGTGVLFGLAPSLDASRPDLMHVLRGGGDARRFLPALGIRPILIVAQIALSVILLTGAALLMQSVIQLHRVDLGFHSANLLTMRVSLPPTRYDTEQRKTSFFEELVRGVESIPGVRGVTTAMFLPMTGFAGSPIQDAAAPPVRLNERPIATLLVVTPNYFRTLQIPLKRGRDFIDRDDPRAQRVAIIDEACARRFWPAYPNGPDPIGQRLAIGGVDPRPARIVGIVADVRQNLEGTAWPETVYVSFAQNPQPSAMLAIRTDGDPLRFVSAVRQQVWAIDRDQPVSALRTMEDLVEDEVGQRRLILKLLGAFAAVALLLTLIGVYGIIAFSVARRTHELGIRRALGARDRHILRPVIGQGLGLALAGVVLGLVGAAGFARVLKGLLFHVSETDPRTYIGVALLFLFVALAASYIPARRAARIDPLEALRAE